MKSYSWVAMLVALGLSGCGDVAQQEKIDELSKKVATLEKRVKTLESGKKGKPAKGKAKAGKGKAKAGGKGKAPVKKGKVEVEGDAKTVVFTNGKKKFKVPGDVPPGEYTVLAAFDAEAEPAQAGTATVVADKAVKVTCTVAEKSCKAEEGAALPPAEPTPAPE